MNSTIDLAPDQAGILQNSDMLRCSGERHGKWLGQVGDGGGAVTKPEKHAAAGPVGQCHEDGVQIVVSCSLC